MKTIPILIVRRPGAEPVSGNRHRPSSDPFFLDPAIEFLFLDIRGGENPAGVAVIRPILQENAAPRETLIKAFIHKHAPGVVYVFADEDDSAWHGKALELIKASVSGPLIYTGQAPCPGVASQVRLGAFENGLELATHLTVRAGQAMEGFDFLLADGFENGAQDVLEILRPWMKLKSGVKFCLHMPVRPKMDFHAFTKNIEELFENGLSMMHWEMTAGSSLPRDLLWKVSKQGIWNHVSGRNLFDPDRQDRSWIANTPNVVHSFVNMGSVSPDAGVTPPDLLLNYGRLPALAGRPLWQVIRDPLLLLPCLNLVSKQQLSRMRVEPAGVIYGIGARMEYFFKPPDLIPGDLMEEIIAMVDAGGSVDITHVRTNLKKAYLIGYAMEKGRVIGNSSLKHPRQVFIDRLKGMTGLDFTHCVERGYTSVRPEYRAMGIGAKLLEGLTARAVNVKVFSIISEDNLATQKIAIRNNTRKITTYFSDKLEKKMGVWMPEHMITTQWEPEKQGPGKQGSDKQESDK